MEIRRITRITVGLAALALSAWPTFGQQDYVTRYDAFAGWAYLNSPNITLKEQGFQTQFGFRPTTWYSVGFDFSNAWGNMLLTPDLLPTALQQTLGAQLGQLAAAKMLPPGYQLKVTADSNTQTFALGPQLAYRHFKKVTLFVRPSMGAIRAVATPTPGDPIAARIVQGLAPAGKKTDWQGFFGVGYGFDVNFSHHFSMRFQGDLVRDHLFNDILRDARMTARFSMGPCLNFGKNIVKK